MWHVYITGAKERLSDCGSRLVSEREAVPVPELKQTVKIQLTI